ncbi:hypothetical protein H1R20_g15146, partial [Candolleomyces eurysporus]
MDVPPRIAAAVPQLLPEPAQTQTPAPSKAANSEKVKKQPPKAAPSLPPPAVPQGSRRTTPKLPEEKLTELADGVWAMLETADAREMAERSAQAIRHLSDIPEVDQVSDSGEEFSVTDISGSSDDEVSANPPTARTSSKSTAEIALLRAKIQELEELSMAKAKKSASKRKLAKNPPSLPFASGLRTSYHEPISNHVTNASAQRSNSPSEMGGLDDEDLVDTRPASNIPAAHTQARLPSLAQQSMKAKNLARDLKRVNKEVVVQEVVIAQGTAPQRQVAAGSRHAPALRRHEMFMDLTANTKLTSRESPAQSNSDQRPTKKGKKHAEKHAEKHHRLRANAVRSADMPLFVEVENKWKDVFLPTLYHTFFLSVETFNAFKSSSSEFHETVQELIDLVYPKHKHVLAEVGDPIVLMAYNRVSGLRSNIAADAINTIQDHLQKNYKGTPGKAYEWLLWARHLDSGPLFFEVPTPFDCPVGMNEPGFVIPRGRMRSPLLISVVQNALKSVSGSLKDRGLVPYGLFAMAMAALERAVGCLKPDGTIDSKVMTNFCQIKWGEAIAGYCDGCTGVSQDKWTAILSLCQDVDTPDSVEPTGIQDEARVIQRVNIFNFPSPTK